MRRCMIIQTVVFVMGATLLASCASKRTVETVREASLRLQLSQQLLAKGETTQALTELFKAKNLDPLNPEIQNTIGLVYAQRDELDKSEKFFKEAVKIDPKYSEAHNHLCAVKIELKDYKTAVEHCEKAASNVSYATPERAYHNMGMAYEGMGKRDDALESYRKALVHNSNFVMTRNAVGRIFIEQGRYEHALSHFEVAHKACLASPSGAWGNACPETMYNLARVYVKLKKRSQAVAAFEKCSKVDEVGEYGRKCREHLKILQ